jgi:hypothetical protein
MTVVVQQRARAEKPTAVCRNNRGDANNIETPGSERMSTTAGPQQHQNANNSIKC